MDTGHHGRMDTGHHGRMDVGHHGRNDRGEGGGRIEAEQARREEGQRGGGVRTAEALGGGLGADYMRNRINQFVDREDEHLPLPVRQHNLR